ncbi:Arc family DNA-binding protein [Chromobacterium amazonense]|uniref:Arc family DNA-binding protein n=1 Tax=Chromobacterium amazonense TaxID=1382803 RepID=UPI003B969293
MSDDGYTRITLRIPTPLDEKLNAAARATSKSKNAEIIQRLEQSFTTPTQIIAQMDQFSRTIHDPNADSFEVARAVLKRNLYEMMLAVETFEASAPSQEQVQQDSQASSSIMHPKS